MTIKNYRKVKTLLADKSRWHQGTIAKDKNGQNVSVNNPKASSFCLVGAIIRVYPDKSRRVVILNKVRGIIQKQFPACSIEFFNDSIWTTHKKVLDVVKKANI